ncbi:hypothetical protein QOT17_017645 [Balamuthia mandrillaris]
MELPTDATGSSKAPGGDNLSFLNSCPWFLQQRFWTDSFSLQAELLKKLKKDANSPSSKKGGKRAKAKKKASKKSKKRNSDPNLVSDNLDNAPTSFGSSEDNSSLDRMDNPDGGFENPHYDVLSSSKKKQQQRSAAAAAKKSSHREKKSLIAKDMDVVAAAGSSKRGGSASSKKKKAERERDDRFHEAQNNSGVVGGGGGGLAGIHSLVAASSSASPFPVSSPGRVQSLPPKKRLRKSFEMELENESSSANNVETTPLEISGGPASAPLTRTMSFPQDDKARATAKKDKKEGSKFLSISSLLNK